VLHFTALQQKKRICNAKRFGYFAVDNLSIHGLDCEASAHFFEGFGAMSPVIIDVVGFFRRNTETFTHKTFSWYRGNQLSIIFSLF